MFQILLMYPKWFKFYKDSLQTFLLTPRSCYYANPHLLFTILERDMMSIFSHSVKFIRRLMQRILDLLSCDLTTSKDQSYQAESAW